MLIPIKTTFYPIFHLHKFQRVFIIRLGHTIRGKPPGIALSLEQRLKSEKENLFNPEKVNIGFPSLRSSRSAEVKERLNHIKSQRKNEELEKLSRNENLLININDVKNEYKKTCWPHHMKKIAEHYGIFNDLFGLAYFLPRIPLNIAYEQENEILSNVFNGNVIMPSEAKNEPKVSFDLSNTSTKNDLQTSYWTLILTNPDCHLFNGKECIHWLKTNIPNTDIEKGDNIVKYLQPFPAKGLGYQRLVFILYKQTDKLDLNEHKICDVNIDKRSFETLEFYRKYQDLLTPCSLAFYQTIWDESLTDFYHNVLNCKEPVFEYDFSPPYLRKQEWFPLRQPFNLYMDKHRDQKKVHEEYLIKKLSETHPFYGPEPSLRFPNAHPLKNMPSWLKTEIRKKNLRIGRINDI